MIKQFYLIHRWKPNSYNHSRSLHIFFEVEPYLLAGEIESAHSKPRRQDTPQIK